MVALFVASMFIGFVLVDLVVQALQARQAAVSTVADLPWNVPKGFYLSEGHTWFHPDSSVGLRVGADALVARALGAVEKVVLPKLGEPVKAGQPLFQLQYHGCELKIPSSITGHVAALNPGLGKRPELVAQDPYGSGWICAITPTKRTAVLAACARVRRRPPGSNRSFIVFESFSPCKSLPIQP